MTKKTDISDMTEKQVRDLFSANLNTVNDERWNKMTERAKIGMAFVRDREIMRRIEQSQTIRVVNLFSSDKDEMKDLIQKNVGLKLIK